MFHFVSVWFDLFPLTSRANPTPQPPSPGRVLGGGGGGDKLLKIKIKKGKKERERETDRERERGRLFTFKKRGTKRNRFLSTFVQHHIFSPSFFSFLSIFFSFFFSPKKKRVKAAELDIRWPRVGGKGERCTLSTVLMWSMFF